MTAYEMEIVFACDISIPDLNKITEQLDGGRMVIQNAMNMTIQQTVLFVPDEDTLRKYAEAIEGYETSRLKVEHARFSRYNYIRPIQLPDPPEKEGTAT